MTQLDQIRNHLLRHETLTGVQAHAIYKARSLTKRISELRSEGMNIISEWKRDATGQRYVKYHYRGLV